MLKYKVLNIEGKETMWHLGLLDNNITHSLSKERISREIDIISLSDSSEHETFYIISHHFSDLPDEEYERAYFKALSFVRLINGCLLLTGDYLLYGADYLTKFDESYSVLIRGRIVGSRNLLEYDQLVNPFEDSIQIEDLDSKSYLANCLTLVKNDEKVRRVIGLLYLYHRDNLYLLVNAYKIYEIILSDLNIQRNEKRYKKVRDTLPEEMLPYLDYFILGDFTHYANTTTSSDGTEVTGIFSRHGESESVYNKNPLDLKELDFNLRNLINAWIGLKIKNYNGKVYNVKYLRTNLFDI